MRARASAHVREMWLPLTTEVTADALSIGRRITWTASSAYRPAIREDPPGNRKSHCTVSSAVYCVRSAGCAGTNYGRSSTTLARKDRRRASRPMS